MYQFVFLVICKFLRYCPVSYLTSALIVCDLLYCVVHTNLTIKQEFKQAFLDRILVQAIAI